MNVDVYMNNLLIIGWNELTLKSDIENICYALSLSIIDESLVTKPTLNKLILQSDALINVIVTASPVSEPEHVFSGYIDVFDASVQPTGITLHVEAREKTADIIDSKIDDAKQIHGQRLVSIASELCKPFNVNVNSTSEAILPIVKLDEAATIFESLDLLTRNQGLILRSNGLGNLSIESPRARKSSEVTLKEGRDLVSYSLKLDNTKRFSEYILKSSGESSDSIFGNAANYKKQTSTDELLKRYRRNVIISESIDTNDTLKERANWQRSYHASKSESITVELTDWLKPNKSIWRVNELVTLETSLLTGVYLIKTVELKISDKGMSASLILVPEHAYTLEPHITIKPKKKDEGIFNK